jgi:1-acyl-sn-glycerol-3-phosphate acyltransferase
MTAHWHYQPASDHGLAAREGLASLRREAGLPQWLMQRLTWKALGAYMQTRHHLTVEQDGLLPDAPFVLVANHCSHLDALTLGAAVGPQAGCELRYLAARDTFFDTAMHSLLAAGMLNAMPLDRSGRGGQSLLALRQRLQDSAFGLVLFPEGTRSRTGEMNAFKFGIGILTAASEIPVIPCHISGSFASWPPGQALPAAGPIHLRIGAPRSYCDVRNCAEGWREVAQDLQSAVAALAPFRPDSGSLVRA